jgi:fibronectin type 3 domain-containing protein
VESDPSASVNAEFKDLVPPPTPTGLTALVEPKAVRILWDPVQAPDLAGYKVYRWEGVGIEKPVVIPKRIPVSGLLTETHLIDPGLTPGIAYYFEVTAVDKKGNESKPAKTEWVVVPKTP